MGNSKDSKIFGIGTLGDGVYNNISILGEAKSSGNVECETLKVMGELKLGGSLKVKDKLKVMGLLKIEKEAVIDTLKVMGELITEDRIEVTSLLKVMGDFNLKGYMKLKEGKILGEVVSKDSIEFDSLNVLGELTCHNCQGNEIKSQGRLNITNLLSADRITIEPYHNSDINEIGGSEITVKKDKNTSWKTGLNIKWNMGWNKDGELRSKLIEGDKIILQNTICDLVRGDDIVILDNCEIKRVEYKNKLEIDKRSNVGESICLKN